MFGFFAGKNEVDRVDYETHSDEMGFHAIHNKKHQLCKPKTAVLGCDLGELGRSVDLYNNAERVWRWASE